MKRSRGVNLVPERLNFGLEKYNLFFDASNLFAIHPALANVTALLQQASNEPLAQIAEPLNLVELRHGEFALDHGQLFALSQSRVSLSQSSFPLGQGRVAFGQSRVAFGQSRVAFGISNLGIVFGHFLSNSGVALSVGNGHNDLGYVVLMMHVAVGNQESCGCGSREAHEDQL
jgi:hypothetical protein